MKKLLFTLSVAILLFVTGCTFSEPVVTPKPAQLPPSKASAAPVSPQPLHQSFSITKVVDAKMRVKFEYPQSEQQFCQKLADRLMDQIAVEKADLVAEAPYDAFIRITPVFEMKDQEENYFRVICQEVRVSISSNKRLLASTTITPEALPRKMGLDNAKNQYLKVIADKVQVFVGEKLDTLTATRLGVTNITFKIANQGIDNTLEYTAEQINKLDNILKRTSGISNYQIIAQDVTKGECTFRIVYMQNSFRQGIINFLSLELAKLNAASPKK